MQVLSHWACAKISASGETADEALLAALDDRLKGQPAIRSCPGVALCACCVELPGACGLCKHTHLHPGICSEPLAA